MTNSSPLHAVTDGRLLHGCDYNPEQWTDVPGIWDEDLRLMKLAGINSATLGIFAWASIEPQEGHFTFDWLDRVMDRLADNGQRVILATPSGGKPNWLALKYEEVRRCDRSGSREAQQGRHNFCWTSPVFREKVTIINTKLAERYGKHPALAVWHLSNEYANSPFDGYCYCPLCFKAFHQWLEARYGTVDRMNRSFWAKFWSHSYSRFDEITVIDPSVHGLELAWKRFMTDRLKSFIEHESEPLRRLTPAVPVTTNFCGTYPPMDYWQIAPVLDIVSWDNYPEWHTNRGDIQTAVETGFIHDIHRPMKQGRPWMLMESTPSQTNWQRVSPLKRPGMHKLASLQAVAHGADAVCYFQFRKSRGSSEKFHGAVVDHAGHEHTRVFREVAEVGESLNKLNTLAGATSAAQAAVIFDWQVNWGITQAQLPRNVGKDYLPTCVDFYRPLWQRGVTTDVIDSMQSFDGYKLLVAPMLYMLRPGVAERIERFVADGGILITTYLSGLVDEDDLCFLGGFPGPLRKIVGVWVEETDALDDGQQQSIRPVHDNVLQLPAATAVRHFCDVVHLEKAVAAAEYTDKFYTGSPAVTVNRYGKGQAIYVGCRMASEGIDAIVATAMGQAQVQTPFALSRLPAGVTVQTRSNGSNTYLFLMNFSGVTHTLRLDRSYHDALDDSPVVGQLLLPPMSVRVLMDD